MVFCFLFWYSGIGKCVESCGGSCGFTSLIIRPSIIRSWGLYGLAWARFRRVLCCFLKIIRGLTRARLDSSRLRKNRLVSLKSTPKQNWKERQERALSGKKGTHGLERHNLDRKECPGSAALTKDLYGYSDLNKIFRDSLCKKYRF